MRLKSIKLAGFKSFVDPTTVRFPGNMSAVVGPNGCGKSNIIDAVRWVMGESSAKHLRGESMADVIFNGSTSRKPVSQASIELIFDGCKGRVSGAFAQYDELSIRRSISRDGQSIYFINGQKTRKRDLTDLFLGTGLGPRSYAIIEQGMISRLVESRPEELRVFVEEAAGISKYKERRRETESRIHRSRENLERLQDVRDELGRQLQALQRQARNAVRYNEFQARSKQIEARLAAIRWQSQSLQAEALAARVETCNQQIHDRLIGRQSREASLGAAREKLAALNKSIDSGQAAFYRASGQVAECEQALKSRLEARQLAQSEGERLLAELEDARIEHDREQDELELLIEEQGDLDEQIEALTETLDSDQHTRAEQAQAFRQLQAELAELQASRRELQRESELKQSMQQQSERLLSQFEDQICSAREELEQNVDERSDEELLLLDGQIGAAREQLVNNESALQAGQADMDVLRGRLAEARSRSQQHRQAEESAATEKRTLERIERESTTQPEGALARWLERLESAGFTLKPLRQNLLIDPQWEHALETILGRRLDALVMQHPQRMKDIPEALLNEIPAGLQLLELDDPTIDSEAARSDFAVRSGLQAPSVVHQWLGGYDTAASVQQIFVRLRADSDLSAACTVLGEIAGRGWLSGDVPSSKQAGAGSAAQHGVLGRQRRLVELAEALEIAVEAREEAEALQSDLDDEMQALEVRDRETNASLREATQTESRLSTSRAALIDSLRRMDDARQRTIRQIETLTEKQSEERSMQTGYKAAWSDALAGIDDIDPLIEAKERAVEQAELAFEGAASRLREQETRLQSLRIAHEGLKARRQGLEAGLLKSGQIQQRTQSQIENNERRLVEAGNAIPELENAFPGLLAARNREESTLVSLREELSTLEAGIREDNTRYGTLDQELESIRAEQSAQRLELQSLHLGMKAQTEILDKLGNGLEAQLELLASENAESGEIAGSDVEQSLELELKQLADKVQKLGAINLAAVEEFETQQTRAEYLQMQQEDLETALTTLEDAIRKIDRETRQKFKETFDAINSGLQTLFPKVFGGGEAYLELTGEDLLDTGITIMARPPGKKNSTIHLLSGGEKALTAIALVFAIFQLNPAPFCMLDEVDAPLDDANVLRYSNIVKEMSSQVQFIYISHNKIAMERADHLLGVTMHEAGVSRLVAVDVESAMAMVGQAG